MRSILFALAALAATAMVSPFSAQPAGNHSLTVEVSHLRNARGVVQFALYNQEGSLPDEKYRKYYKLERAEIIDGRSRITFSGLPEGRYAVNVLHDENNNGKIDRGFILPREGIGFSNYASIGLSNRPDFSRASFELKEDRKIEIKIIYL